MKRILIFSHGNGFPGGTYNVMLQALQARGFEVHAVDKFGHDPRYKVSNNWPHLVHQLYDFAQPRSQPGAAMYLVGHSLGGFLSLLCAARHPELARGVVMLDSPLIGGWRATGVGVAKRTQLIDKVSPGAVSAHRRTSWANAQAALEHFAHKKAFAKWHPQALQDYIEHGTHDEDGKRVLSFDREIETAIYNTIPHNIESTLRRHPLKCPAAFIGGLHSSELAQAGIGLTEKVCKGRISMLDGTHLYPMEQPLAAAAMVEAAVLNFESSGYVRHAATEGSKRASH